jgi:hypothetical protein
MRLTETSEIERAVVRRRIIFRTLSCILRCCMEELCHLPVQNTMEGYHGMGAEVWVPFASMKGGRLRQIFASYIK